MFKPKMLTGRHLRVWEARTVEDFKKEVIGFGRSLGFDTVSAMTVIDHSRTHTEFFNVENIPSGYHETFNNSDVFRRDPVMQHCKRSSVPLVWDWRTYHEEGEVAVWEEQAAFGLKTGIALALHLPGDRHLLIGVDRDKPLVDNSRVASAIAEVQLFAIHAQDAAGRIYAPDPLETSAGTLTPRELEALRWTMDGKTAAEIGDALNISTSSAIFHLRNATAKMGCGSKHHAVLKAIQFGLFR